MTPAIEPVPKPGVERADDRWLASAPDPWLTLPGLERWRGRWLRLRYHAGLFDEMVRPLLRFRMADGSVDHAPMSGALLGVGEWIGRVPEGTVEVAVSPVRRAGAFSFRVVLARPVSRLVLLARGLRRQPAMALTALGARLIGARDEARHCLAFASLGTPLRDYARWREDRSRPIDLAGFDRPHSRWSEGPTVHLIVRAPADPVALATTSAAPAEQSYPCWRLHVADAVDRADQRVVRIDADAPLASLGSPDDLIAIIRAGDRLLPHALAGVIEHFAAAPGLLACYGEEEGETEGEPACPRLKPDMSPTFAASAGYVGDGAFVRLSAFARPMTLRDAITSPSLLAEVPREAIGHLRRLIYRRDFHPSPHAGPATVSARCAATVVIPTRDRPALLAACLAGLRDRTACAGLEIVIVDNGTTDAAALALIDGAARKQAAIVLRAPGPFNYAALCNDGAAAGTAPLIVFLNNDITMIEPDWLDRLAARAMRPDIGAVGARLLFPDGRLQHGGVVVGLGGTALHLHRFASGGAGYLEQLDHAREVGAVTGAVLAVERAKFDAVGGFDAEAFPVLLNDIDLCLRLAERGWRTLYEPTATLVHAESASRGRAIRPLLRHREERRRFAARWRDVIRHDPCFHPALSLWSTDPALG